MGITLLDAVNQLKVVRVKLVGRLQILCHREGGLFA
jgi:hypothetical protein